MCIYLTHKLHVHVCIYVLIIPFFYYYERKIDILNTFYNSAEMRFANTHANV